MRRLLVVVLALAIIGVAAFWVVTAPARIPASALPPRTPDLANGKTMFNAGGCAACHAPDKEDRTRLSGNVALKSPFGTFYAPNISPDPGDGIGAWSEADFVTAMLKGASPSGTHYYPAFPYGSYQRMKLDDVRDLFAYLSGLPPVKGRARDHDLPSYLKIRRTLGGWKFLFLDGRPFVADPARSAQWNRGAYLVEGLEHCSACHSPRNSLGAERSGMALTGGVYTDQVSADSLRTWSAPNLTSAPNGLASWSVEEIVGYLKTGRNSAAATFGPMNEVIMNSTQYLTDADLHAMATYLKALPANPGDVGAAASEEVTTAGSAVYDVHCGTCHQPSGMGADDSGPRLAGSLVVQATDPASLINIIIYGPQLPQPAPPVGNWKKMDPYGDKLSDDEIAQLASYLRGAWGNKGGEVTAAQVAKQR
jgi:mono/diheme cytochrome c family protein